MHPEKAIPANLPRSFAGAHLENMAEGAGFSSISKCFYSETITLTCPISAFIRSFLYLCLVSKTLSSNFLFYKMQTTRYFLLYKHPKVMQILHFRDSRKSRLL